MSNELPKHGERVEELLTAIEQDKEAMLELGMRVVGPTGSSMFPLDLLVLAATKRSISTSSAFATMIRSWNMVCARSLLRMHIDTSLRFSAAWFVAEPHVFATLVAKGERIDKMKDRTGKKLTDAHLIELQKIHYPWLPGVYASLSGYVHFSGSHLSDAIAGICEDKEYIQFAISDKDLKFPEFSWIEILECFRETNEILAKYLHGYSDTKQLSPTELAAMSGGV
jgi:hypothetical protein